MSMRKPRRRSIGLESAGGRRRPARRRRGVRRRILRAGEGGAQLFERKAPANRGSPLRRRCPDGSAPGSLALFREGGALRVDRRGSAPDGFRRRKRQPLAARVPAAAAPALSRSRCDNGLERRPPDGARLERRGARTQRRRRTARQVLLVRHRLPARSDPAGARQPDGTQGWAVGGFVDTEGGEGGALDTADVERYPADGVTPPGRAPRRSRPNPARRRLRSAATPNARLPARIAQTPVSGPTCGCRAALARAGQIAGVRAFLYSGPRVTTGETSGPPTLVVPYAREFARYAAAARGAPPADLHGELAPPTSTARTASAHSPNSSAGFRGGLAPASRSEEPCSGQAGYYELNSSGPAARSA